MEAVYLQQSGEDIFLWVNGKRSCRFNQTSPDTYPHFIREACNYLQTPQDVEDAKKCYQLAAEYLRNEALKFETKDLKVED